MRAHASRRRLGIALLTALAALAVACGPEPTPTPAADPDLAYLQAFDEARAPTIAAITRVGDLLGPIFPRTAPDELQARVLFNALAEADLPTAFADSLVAFDALRPPPSFAADHAPYTDALRSQVASGAALADAVSRRDLPRLHLQMAELQVEMTLAAIAVSKDLCRRILGNIPDIAVGVYPQRTFCEAPEAASGDYGRAVDQLVKRWQARFGPRANFPQAMTPSELLEGLTYVQPAIIAAFDETIAELAAIQPPEEYALGHELLSDYFGDLRTTALAIDRAVADGDFDRVQREFERSGDIADTARDRLPENFRPLVGGLFPDD